MKTALSERGLNGESMIAYIMSMISDILFFIFAIVGMVTNDLLIFLVSIIFLLLDFMYMHEKRYRDIKRVILNQEKYQKIKKRLDQKNKPKRAKTSSVRIHRR